MDVVTLAHRWFRALNARRVAVEMLAADVTSVVPGSDHELGAEATLGFVTGLMTVFPDLRYELNTVVAFENRVLVEGLITGTHRAGLPPASDDDLAGKAVRFRFCAVIDTRGGQIVSYHVYYDELDLLKQLGQPWHPDLRGMPPDPFSQ